MFEFLALADIHHDCYTNGITLDDTISIEDQVTRYAVDHKIKYVIFAGDGFRATNPTQQVIKAAEAAWKRRSDAGVVTFALPGNHDWWLKSSVGGHAFASASIFTSDLKNIRVIDKACIQNIDGVEFAFIPAGHKIPDWHLSYPSVVVFHGMVAGSLLENGGTARGMPPESLRTLGGSLYMGGDNHTPQRLSGLGPSALYLGAPIQHTWGARGQNRGFWHFIIGESNIEVKFVAVKAPRFVRVTVPATNDVETLCRVADAVSKEVGINPAIIDITLIGREAPNINTEFIHDNIFSMFSVRQFRISVDRTFEKIEIAPDMQQLSTAEDKWNAYVVSGVGPNMSGLQPKMLSDIGVWAIQEARKII